MHSLPPAFFCSQVLRLGILEDCARSCTSRLYNFGRSTLQPESAQRTRHHIRLRLVSRLEATGRFVSPVGYDCRHGLPGRLCARLTPAAAHVLSLNLLSSSGCRCNEASRLSLGASSSSSLRNSALYAACRSGSFAAFARSWLRNVMRGSRQASVAELCRSGSCGAIPMRRAVFACLAKTRPFGITASADRRSPGSCSCGSSSARSFPSRCRERPAD